MEPAPSSINEVTEKSGLLRAEAASVVVEIKAGVMLDKTNKPTKIRLDITPERELDIVCTCLFVSLNRN